MKWNKKNLLKLKAFLLLSSKLPVPRRVIFDFSRHFQTHFLTFLFVFFLKAIGTV